MVLAGYRALEPRPRRTVVAALCAAAAAAVLVARARAPLAAAAPLGAAALGSDDRADDEPSYGSIQTVVTTYNASRMKLYARVRVTLRSARAADAPFVGAVQYAPSYGDDDDSDPLLPLWTPNATFSAASDGSGALSAEFHVFRLRPATRYAFRVWVSAGGAAAARSDVAHATVPATGWARFDDAPLAAVSGGVPQWQTLTMAYALKVAGHRDVHFNGIVAVDQAGWVVWYRPRAPDLAPSSPRADEAQARALSPSPPDPPRYYAANFNRTVGGHGGAPGAWDFLPAADGYAMVLLEVGYADPFSTADGRRWRANSALLQVDPWGALQTQYVQACSGAALNYNQLSHEMRVDHTSADRRVLTTRMKVKRLPGGVQVRVVDAPKETSTWTSDAFVGVEVVAWHRDANVVSGVHDLWDVASPDEPSWDPAETTWKRLTGLRCSGASENADGAGGPDGAVDYHHVSSVSVGPSGDLIVASRNLNTIWAFDAAGARAGAAPKWTLGALAGHSDFAFDRPLDRFYAPHAALELADGRLLVMDDGSSRPGCVGSTDFKGCWSRAALYTLDRATNRTALSWQFEDPQSLNALGGGGGDDDAARAAWYEDEVMTRDSFNFDGGSAYRLDGGRILVAFTSP